MKVILLQDIKALGKKGELAEVSEGYGRNYLLPKKLAKEANAQAMNEYAEAEKSKQALEGKILRMKANGNNGRLFGSVTSKQIAEEIRKQYGINVDKRKVVLDRDIKEFGTYKAEVKLYTGISAMIDVQVGEA